MAAHNSAPLFDRSIEARPNRAWAELTQLAAHTPRLRLDLERHHAVFSSTDESELDRTVKDIARQLSVGFQISDAAAAVRLRLNGEVVVDVAHSPDEARKSEFARLKLLFRSGPPGSGFRFQSSAPLEAVPTRFATVISRVLRRSSEGLFADLHASLLDGAGQSAESTAAAFEHAALSALHDVQVARLAELVEPVGRVRVQAPEGVAQPIAAELRRRGAVRRGGAQGAIHDLEVDAPASRLLGLPRRLAEIAGEPVPCAMSLCDYRPLFEGRDTSVAPSPSQDIELGELLASVLGVAFPVGVATVFERELG